MKKLTTIVLALVMALSLCSTAFATLNNSETFTSGVAGVADTFDKANGSDQVIDVTGSYSGTPTETYSVDVKWDAMEFVYTANDQTQWDPENHTYVLTTGGEDTAAWSANGGDTVTVTNHSNKAVNVAFRFDKESGVNGTYTGSFTYTDSKNAVDNGTVKLDAGVENAYAAADKVVAKLTLDGTLAAGTTTTKLGTITVRISAVA